MPVLQFKPKPPTNGSVLLLDPGDCVLYDFVFHGEVTPQLANNLICANKLQSSRFHQYSIQEELRQRICLPMRLQVIAAHVPDEFAGGVYLIFSVTL